MTTFYLFVKGFSRSVIKLITRTRHKCLMRVELVVGDQGVRKRAFSGSFEVEFKSTTKSDIDASRTTIANNSIRSRSIDTLIGIYIA